MSRIPRWVNVSSLVLRLVLFAGVAICAQHAGPAWAVVIYVRDDATGASNGQSWADADTDLQAALAAAVSGDEIWVAQGTYKPTTGTDRTVSFVLKAGVGLYGGFAGAETERGQRDWKANATILSGDIGTAGSAGDNSYHVVIGAYLAGLDGFTVTGGNANGSESFDHGGGMYTGTGSLTVTNCTFSGNMAIRSGGGMCSFGGSSTVTNCTFTGNTAGSVFGGGGMSSWNGSPIVTDCTFNGNTGDYGGGILNLNISMTVINCTFSGNTALYGGGGMLDLSSFPTVTNCTFSGNTATTSGGGMLNVSGSATMTNCIFWDNTAPVGAEIYKGTGTPTFRHCDIRGSGGSGASWDPALGVDGGGNIGGDPRFVAPSTPAGPDGLWRTRDDGLRLRSDSPCIGAADLAVAPKRDILGLPRKTAPDIGAYEFWPPASADPAWLLFR